MHISGEEKQVDIEVVKDWKTELPDIISSFGEEDIFNCDEASLFYKTTSNYSLVLPHDDGIGNKKFRELKP